ncbi:MAG: PhnE/PtxC family ABC transporter permease [Planctomycetota bacterium]
MGPESRLRVPGTPLGLRAIVLLSIAVSGLGAVWFLGLDPAGLVPSEGGLVVAKAFFAHAFSPALRSEGQFDAAILPVTLESAWMTVVFAAAAISISLVFGLIGGFLGSTAWWAGNPGVGARESGSGMLGRVRRIVGPVIYAWIRILIALLRSVHELLWAVIFLAAFGLNHLTAVIAISIPYTGTFAKIFSEIIDETPRDASEALRDLGASPLQVFFYGLIPRALPDLGAYAFYRFECALRSSAVLGFFGLPTLGREIKLSFQSSHYGETWTHLYALLFLVVVFDVWSGALRRRVLHD